MKIKHLAFLMISVGALLLTDCKKENTEENQSIDEEFFTGLIPSELEDIRLIPVLDTSILFSTLKTSIPSSYALDMPEIRTQGGEGSCASFATAYAVRSYLLHRDQSISYQSSTTEYNNVVFSPEFLYNMTKQPGNCKESGTLLVNALKFLEEEGVSTWNIMPYSDQNGCDIKPNINQINNAKRFKIKGSQRFPNICVTPSYIKAILNKDVPIIIGIKVDKNFRNLKSGVLNEFDSKKFIGYHAVVICGWDDSKNAYKIMNSWPPNMWGDKGYGWIHYDLLFKILIGNFEQDLNEMYVVQSFGYDSTLTPKIETLPAFNITQTDVSIRSNVVNDAFLPEAKEAGICFSTKKNPDISNLKAKSSARNGQFVIDLTGLEKNTKYYARGYAINDYGIDYGNEISFTTQSETATTLATVVIDDVIDINQTNFELKINVLSDGGASVIERGICWDTKFSPTIYKNKIYSGGGTGIFYVNVTGLNANTTYYVRAYAKNSVGIAYGNESVITTDALSINPYLNPNLTYGTVTDIDGNSYATIRIGNQTWMAENLKVAHYNDETTIPNVINKDVWGYLSSGAWTYYSDDDNYNNIYGKLYNWFAINTGKLCPKNWHVPNDDEWRELSDYLGGINVAGGKLKSIGTNNDIGLWYPPNTGATNQSGFTGLPGGYKRSDGGYQLLSSFGYWWSSTENGDDQAWARNVDYYYSSLSRYVFEYKTQGFSCRCVKD